MKYNFDRLIDRSGTFAVKWDKQFLKEHFKTDDVLPLWVADMDFQCPQPVIDALKKRAAQQIYGYSWHKTPTYLDAVSNWMKRRHSWKIDNDWIVFSPGIVPAIKMIVQTFTNVGEKVIVQPPVYYPFFSAVENNGRILSKNQLNYENKRYTFDFEDFEEKAKDPLTKMFILCSPHNPVGRVWTEKELRRLGDICLENNVLIISDEIHHDLILSGYKHTLFSTISEEFERNTIMCTAPSKTFNIAGLKTSNIIIPDEKLREKFTYTISNRNSVASPNAFGIVALIAAYNEGEEWLDQALKYIEANFNFLKRYVYEQLPDVDFIDPEGTYLAWLDCTKLGMNDEELSDFMLKKAKVALDDGKIFGPGGEGFERINVACPRSILEECMNRIVNAIKLMK
ncbi:MAG: pyridoxal phosphate-dependent aminotransferase [Promethearchaeota archaeon]|nr:MAG: pyridoxal phosphate-dependent aminotransferase [Candidatus Lokiarchaeota archaeon]